MARVLVVEDQEDVLAYVRLTLESAGHEVVAAQNVEEAREVLQTAPAPDLVFLDWMLPGEPGTRLLREIKSSPETRGISVVMLTAKPLIKDKEQAHKLGASGYLVKPVTANELRASVERFTSGTD